LKSEIGQRLRGPPFALKFATEPDQLRASVASVCNAIFRCRKPEVWGEGTTACASDSKQFGAWDQNLLTEWHMRYGGRGVMIYWHVEKNSVCIYSQLKAPSSSEVSSMIEGVLRHDTEMFEDRRAGGPGGDLRPRRQGKAHSYRRQPFLDETDHRPLDSGHYQAHNVLVGRTVENIQVDAKCPFCGHRQ
jgi:hypothetical protein